MRKVPGVRTALSFSLVALVALALVVVPGGGPALDIVLTLLTVAFFTAIALFAFRLYREQRFRLESLTDGQRFVLYGSIGLAFLAFAALPRLFDEGGVGVLAWIGLLGIASLGVYWVIASARRYE